MKINQIVYVVIDLSDKTIMGVYNSYGDAYDQAMKYNSDQVSITPVLVDYNDKPDRPMCYSASAVKSAEKSEIALAYGIAWDEDEDEDEVDSYADDDDEDEDDEEDEDYDEDEDEDDSWDSDYDRLKTRVRNVLSALEDLLE